MPPVPGLAPAAQGRHPLRRLRAVPAQSCPAESVPPTRIPPPGPAAAAGQERHAALPGGPVRSVRDGAQPDGRGAQCGRRLLPHVAGRLLHPGRNAAHHPDQPLLSDERREGEVGQGASQGQGEREKAELQSAGVHLGVLSRPCQRFTHQGGRATCVQISVCLLKWHLRGLL